MKKRLIIVIVTVILAAIFIVLGMKAIQSKSTAPSVTKVPVVYKVPKEVTDIQKPVAKLNDVPKVADNSTSKPEKDIVNLKEINSSVLAQTDTWAKTLATVTPQNSTSVFAKLNSMGLTPYLTDEFKNAYSGETITNMSYNITKVSAESLKNNKTGKQDTCEIVYFNFKVKVTIGSISIPSRLFFARNANNEYKLTDCEQDAPIKN